MPQPRTWSRATLPKRPLSRQDTDVTEFVRQLRTAANAVAIRAPSISYCEPFAIANRSRFGASRACGRDLGGGRLDRYLKSVSKKRKRKAAARIRTASTPQQRAAGRPAKPTRPDRPNSRRSGALLGGLAGVLVAGALIIFVINLPKAGQTSPTVPPAAPSLLATTNGMAQGQPVDGISCQTAEQLVYHIHAHLAVYVGGTQRGIPAGIGIVPPVLSTPIAGGPFVYGGTCFYWLHSHTQDGIIHIESPTQRIYTLGNYFDIWNQPLSATQVGPAHGVVTAYVDGKAFAGDPRSIPLVNHTLIQLDVGSGSPGPQPFTFPAGL
jgi:hypothetical protein